MKVSCGQVVYSQEGHNQAHRLGDRNLPSLCPGGRVSEIKLLAGLAPLGPYVVVPLCVCVFVSSSYGDMSCAGSG